MLIYESADMRDMCILKSLYSSRDTIKKKYFRSDVQYFSLGVDKTEFQCILIVSMLNTGVLGSPL